MQGASTLTQQYVKITLAGERPQGRQGGRPGRDAQDLQRASSRSSSTRITLEKKFTKDQILEGYLNIVYYGDRAYGVEAAAPALLQRPRASKLTLAQAALLAGLVQQPTAYDPVLQPEGGRRPGATSCSTGCTSSA